MNDIESRLGEQLVIRQGDLFTTTSTSLGHGVNTCGVMGAGIAKEFRRRWPAMYREYVNACHADDPSRKLLAGGLLPWERPEGGWIYNLASQDLPGRHARLEWLAESAERALSHADSHEVDTIALPRIGCGIGGLSWPDVQIVLRGAQRPFRAKFEVWL